MAVKTAENSAEINPLAEHNIRMQTDLKYFAHKNITIKPKEGPLQKLVFNETQDFVHDKLEKQLRDQGYVRARILKARQQGISTLIGGRYYYKTSRGANKTTQIIAHEDKATNNLFGMAKTMYEHDQQQPETRYSSAKELVFDNDKGTGLKSRYVIQNAGSVGGAHKGGGRSFTLHYLHGSEVAWWGEAGATILGGAMESVPSEEDSIKGTEIILETTANGLDAIFYKGWVATEKKIREGEPTDWINIFIPWFYHKGYQRTISDTEREDILSC